MTADRSSWDPSNFIKDANLPTFWINGDQDGNFSLESTTKSADLLGDNSLVSIIPNFNHGHGPAWDRKEGYAFADSIVKDGAALIKPGEPAVGSGTVSVTLNKAPASTALRYTTSTYGYKADGVTPLTGFTSSSAYTNSGLTYTYTIPAGTKAFYIDFTDASGIVTSTKLIKLD